MTARVRRVSSSWSANLVVCAPLTESTIRSKGTSLLGYLEYLGLHEKTTHQVLPSYALPLPFVMQLAVCDSPLSAFVSAQDCTHY